MQEAVELVVHLFTMRKTCAHSGVMSEAWQAYLDTDPHAATHWAWASTACVMSRGGGRGRKGTRAGRCRWIP